MSVSFRVFVISAAMAFAGAAFAAAPAAQHASKEAATAPAAKKPLTTQQQRMKDCNHEATGKKGDERKAFMSSCLKGKSGAAAATAAAPAAPAAKAAQQEKMKSCNAEAKTKALKGADRKTFMSTCLKGEAAAAAAAH